MNQLPQALLEVKPTFLVRCRECTKKFTFKRSMKAKGFPNSSIYHWACRWERNTGRKSWLDRLPTSRSWKLADRLLYSKVRAGLGGRIEIFISGGAPLGRELAEWYAAIGIRIHEGYGLTETSPVIAVNTPKAHKLGTVGKPLPNVEVRIAEDGEILVRGPSVFKGYWNKPKETQEAFVDGWFKTGDIGNLDADGFLSITDRKKDLIKTSGGKFIAPQPIENSLKHNALVGGGGGAGREAQVSGGADCAEFSRCWKSGPRNHEVVFSSRQDLVAHPEVRALYEGIVEELNRNLARFEQLKKVLLVAEEFSAGEWDAHGQHEAAAAGGGGALSEAD